MNAVTYFLSQNYYSSECSFCITESTHNFPIAYASAGFKDLFGFNVAECVGMNCGSLVGGSQIKSDKASLAFLADICECPTEAVETAIDILTSHSRDLCESFHNHPEENCNFALVLNRKKSGELFVCEFRLQTFMHPKGFAFSVGFQYDVTDLVPISMLLNAALTNEHHSLMKSHSDNVESQRLSRVGEKMVPLGVNEKFLEWKADEACLRSGEIRGLGTSGALVGSLPDCKEHREIKSNRIEHPCCSLHSSPDICLSGDAVASEDLCSRVAIVRHGERADAVWGDPWMDTADAKVYSFDAPITQRGLAQAKQVASDLSQCGGFDIVVSSPFLRCVQTSLILADILDARLIIDNGLGEMFTPKLFGEHSMLDNPLRTLHGLAVASESIKSHLQQTCEEPWIFWEQVVGSPPVWPESEEAARHRYSLRLLAYLKRARKTKLNYVLVGHRGLLEETLRMLPATSNAEVKHVGYCATIVAMWPHRSSNHWLSSPISEDAARSKSEEFDDEDVELSDASSATQRRIQAGRWAVGTEGIELYETSNGGRRLRRPSCDRFGKPLTDLQNLLGKAFPNKSILSSIGDLSRMIETGTNNLRPMKVCENELECLSTLTVSELPPSSPTSPTSPSFDPNASGPPSPTSTFAPSPRRSSRASSAEPASPFRASRAEQALKYASMTKCAKACEPITFSALLTRRASRQDVRTP